MKGFEGLWVLIYLKVETSYPLGGFNNIPVVQSEL